MEENIHTIDDIRNKHYVCVYVVLGGWHRCAGDTENVE